MTFTPMNGARFVVVARNGRILCHEPMTKECAVEFAELFEHRPEVFELVRQ